MNAAAAEDRAHRVTRTVVVVAGLALALELVLVQGGCAFTVESPRLACNVDDDCAADEVCDGGGCFVASRGLPVAPVDVVTTDTAAAPAQTIDPCGDLVDGFDAALFAPVWTPFVNGAVQVLQSDGSLEVDLPPSSPQEFVNGGVFAGPLRIADRSVTVEIPEVPADANSFALLALEAPGAPGTHPDQAFIAIADGRIVTGVVHGADEPTAETAYDPENDRFLRIRESDGQVHFEVSKDGAAFFFLSVFATPSIENGAFVALGAQAAGASTGARARFATIVSPSIACP